MLYFSAFVCVKAQCTIELPDSNLEVNYNSLTPFFNVKVCSNENVYIEDTLVEIENLADSLFVYKDGISAELMLRLQIHLFADKNVKSSLIDKIKSQITRAHIYTLMYRTNNIEDVMQGIFLQA
ncbi:hypothetical protein EGM88_10010 [Aureibaculum marinum]|uniref:Uncharacterized protein n=2 Tax=Aureibaculum marinum TaxID=2487930 RepID=A0A3N4NK35_9FLAO|nr:hypothetical protein EGM88_10010 [Aureibaculum marinum]